MHRCSIQPVSLHEVRENNGRAGLVRTALYSRNVRAVPKSMTISCAERAGERHVARHQPVVPAAEVATARLVNKDGKRTASSGGGVKITHVQTYARVIQQRSQWKTCGRAHHLLMRAGLERHGAPSQETSGEGSSLHPLVFLANAACLRQRDKTVANKTPPHQKGLIKSSIYLSVALDK